MEMVGWFAVVVFVALWHKLNSRYSNDSLSPFNLLLFFWVTPFCLSLFKLSGLQQGYSFEAFLLMLTVTLTLSFVSLSAIMLTRSAERRASWQLVTLKPPQNHGLALVVCAYSIALVVDIQLEFSNGIPLFSYVEHLAESGKGYRDAKASPFQIIAQVLPVTATFLIYHLTTQKRLKVYLRILLWLMVVLVPLLGILIVSKSDIFIPLIGYAGMLYYIRKAKGKTISSRHMLIIFSSISALFGWLTYLRVSGVEVVKTPVYYSELIRFKYLDLPLGMSEVFSLLYGYSALTFENFSRYFDASVESYRFGSSALRPFLSLLMQGRVASEMLEGIDLHYLSSAATVGTFMRDVYIEGGACWTVLVALSYAILVNYVYVLFKSKKTPTLMIAYLVVLYPWVWLFFTNAFSNLTTFTNLFFAAVIARLYFGKTIHEHNRHP